MAKHTGAVLHFLATVGLLATFIQLLLISLSGPTWRTYSLMTVNLKNDSKFEAVEFSRDRNSYVTYGTFGYCIQNIDMGGGYQEKSCSDPIIGYPITKIQSAIDGTKFFKNNHVLDDLTKVMVLHPVSAVVTSLAFLFSIRSGYLRSVGSVILTLVAWIMVTVAMVIEWIIFGTVYEHIESQEAGVGSEAYFGGALWCLVVCFILLTFATVLMSITAYQQKFAYLRSDSARVALNRPTRSASSSPVRRFGGFETRRPFWRHRAVSHSSSSSTSRDLRTLWYSNNGYSRRPVVDSYALK